MKAALLETAPGELVVDDLTVAAPGPDEVLVRTAACGLCHSDLHIIEGKLPMSLPAVLGHEAAGVVEAVGEGVTEFSPGDHVVGCLSVFCGTCRECSVGNTFLCEQRRALEHRADGTSRLTRRGEPVRQMTGLGGFAETMLVHRNGIVRVPEELPLHLGALLGCAVITGVGAVFNSAKVRPGSTVAVIGAGGIGLNIVQGARLAGAERIVAVDLNPEKLALAETFGATDVVDGSGGDAVEQVIELTGGGVDAAFEAIGLPATAGQAFQMIRPGRTAYLVGVPAVGSTIELPGTLMSLQARGLQGVFMGSNHFKRDIPMLANLYLQGRLKLDELVAAEITLDEVNDGYEAMRRGTEARSVIVFGR
jgi:S-(hydroxymethyl)glutathione dehydrogenase/alcohol dehydrogenase